MACSIRWLLLLLHVLSATTAHHEVIPAKDDAMAMADDPLLSYLARKVDDLEQKVITQDKFMSLRFAEFMMLSASVSVHHAAVQEQTSDGWAGVPSPPADDSATDADILAELVKVKKIQLNMKRLFTGQIEALEKQVKSLEDSETDSLQAMQSQFQTLILQFESKIASVAASGSGSGGGSSYVRWGRKTCPDGASQVYAGVVGGKHYAHAGGATNALCLTKEPEYDNTTKPVYYGYLYGAEYEYIGDNLDQDVPCSVCVAPKATTIMVPARITCPEGWTAQYSGHLVSEYYGRAATEYLCLDGSPEVEVGGEPNKNGFLLYLVLTKCGSLPCPPYEDDLVTTCVVCSK